MKLDLNLRFQKDSKIFTESPRNVLGTKSSRLFSWKCLTTVKILKIGTQKIITVIVLKYSQLLYSLESHEKKKKKRNKGTVLHIRRAYKDNLGIIFFIWSLKHWM